MIDRKLMIIKLNKLTKKEAILIINFLSSKWKLNLKDLDEVEE